MDISYKENNEQNTTDLNGNLETLQVASKSAIEV